MTTRTGSALLRGAALCIAAPLIGAALAAAPAKAGGRGYGVYAPPLLGPPSEELIYEGMAADPAAGAAGVALFRGAGREPGRAALQPADPRPCLLRGRAGHLRAVLSADSEASRPASIGRDRSVALGRRNQGASFSLAR